VQLDIAGIEKTFRERPRGSDDETFNSCLKQKILVLEQFCLNSDIIEVVNFKSMRLCSSVFISLTDETLM
jgi:hypothetical protein